MALQIGAAGEPATTLITPALEGRAGEEKSKGKTVAAVTKFGFGARRATLMGTSRTRLSGQINRREFIQMSAALGGVVMSTSALSAFLVACTTGGTSTGTVKQLVLGVSATPPGVDPEFYNDQASSEAIDATYDNLTGFPRVQSQTDPYVALADTGRLVGRLAQSWDVSSDGKTTTFHLRHGVISHYGNELTADDIKWRWDRSFAVKATGSFFLGVMGVSAPASVKVIDRYTVSVTADYANPLVPGVLGVHLSKAIDSVEAKKHATSSDPWAKDWLKTNAAGHGPYKLTSLEPGVQAVFQSRTDWYGGKPKIDKFIYKEIPSSATRLALLQSGSIDVAGELSPKELSSLSGNSGIHVVSVPSNQMERLVLNNSLPMFKDKRVRQAMQFATPQQDIVSSVYLGAAVPAQCAAPADFPNSTTEFWTYQYDVNKAKQLLAAAGYSNGFQMKILYDSSQPNDEQIAIILQSAYAKVGISATLDKQPPAAWNELGSKGQFDTQVNSFAANLPNVSYLGFLFWASKSSINWGRYTNSDVDQQIHDGLNTVDPAARTVAERKLLKTLADDAPDVFIVNPNYQLAVRSNVTNVVWLPTDYIRFPELSVK